MTINTQNFSTLCQQSSQSDELSLGMIFHEIRAPLTSIFFTLSNLEEIELPSIHQRQLSLALQEAKRLQFILNDSLSLFGASQLQFQEIELNSLISETIELVSHLPVVQTKPIKLNLSSEQIWIQGDSHKLQQVLINLLTNAAEAIASEEIITCAVDSNYTSNLASIEIYNGGNPIPSDILSRLKEPFFTTKPNGTGLGLAIVERIIRAHSGQFLIKSEASKGTNVTVSLPLSMSN